MLARVLVVNTALVALVTNAQAADQIIAPEPEPVEYVRICDAYGSGYFYIPGTQTCMSVGGYVRYTIQGGTDAYSGDKFGGWQNQSRLSLTVLTASETELGTLKTNAEFRLNWEGNASTTHTYGEDSRFGGIEYAYVTLGGFLAGYAPTAFTNYINLGNVVNDDVVSQGQFTPSGQLSYTYTNTNGFTGVIAVEQGSGDYIISNYTPYFVGSFQYVQGWGSVASSVAYDSVIRGWSGQLNAVINVTDKFSIWAVGGYSNKETDDQAYGSWGGKWAVWGGAAYQFTEKAAFNIQGSKEDWGMTSVTANIVYEPFKDFEITPEVTWTRFKNNGHYDYEKKDAIQGLLRFKRSF
ncbi:porin [Brucellaceae bacterium C25G]